MPIVNEEVGPIEVPGLREMLEREVAALAAEREDGGEEQRQVRRTAAMTASAGATSA